MQYASDSMLYAIVPYVGAGPLKLGMTQADAYVILGEPELAMKDADGPVESVTLYWEGSGIQLIFDVKNDSLVSISFYSNIKNVELDGAIINWNKTKELYNYLVKSDCTAKEALGITVFFEKGISVDGFETNYINSKSLTVFAHGQFDPNDPVFKPLSVK
ncbi:hypothetical protein LXA47_19425 [Massilia sp. P8910]|uniref:hypothetical protein n=1 Tax=Massilia antarctica TaxID=2765360 RepID=UPI001E65B2AC|nr:hypothetical protein [Massilia antarctica]MCE3605759.1 hypothetical protein [Massilia antarctica]